MAIAAHFEETAAGGSKARASRRKLLLEAQGALASGDSASVLVHNISATGLLLESRIPLAIDEAITVDLPESEATPAKVVWTSGHLFGCRFDTPISAAVLSAAELRSAVDADVTFTMREETVSNESFGVRLQRLRKERGLTLAQVAEELGVSKPTVWAWEQGRARPVDSRVQTLADVLGVGRAELLAGHDTAELRDLLARSKEQIAVAFHTNPDNVRIMIEL
ncbi:XRE family transcriptional regulator [Croceicoccus estronivorus]|uniref:helix-turn-helix domain-containing protein n=1 Tax=Croceicoccus estronivorus TaxID=1172626 RepID=UPI0008348B8E|nr:helix-turn-helix domain-containing protein [Croceicoccus estronivorus]OCC25086.1 XRE family transcriptional regulator [Croceicoccus estronivorus]